MKRNLKFCPNCGAERVPNERFCGDCGYDTQSVEPSQSPENRPIQTFSASSGMELWRRLGLLAGILVGLALFCYVTPAVVSLTAVDWEQEQAKELNSASGYVSEEDKRLSQLPLANYIQEKTDGKVTVVNNGEWLTLLTDVQLASHGQYERSAYGNRVSEEDKDPFWEAIGPVAVFFEPDEIPYTEWGLTQEDLDRSYISIDQDGQTAYFLLRYHDYSASVSAMSKPYTVAPDWLYHPYRKAGIAVLLLGLAAYIFLPRRKKEPEEIAYSTGSMLAGDLVALILLLPFYGLPFLINGGTVQAVSGFWIISAVMWFLALLCVLLFYYNAWYASYRITLTAESLSLITFRGVREYKWKDITEANFVTLRNPGWFRKLFLAMAFLSVMGGRTSTQPAGSALLAASAAYSGLEIQGTGGKPLYIWFTNQNGGVIINNFDKVLEAIEASGVRINRNMRSIEGFSMFM
ncbi:zinc ribbon domain-containing protein [Dehalobacter sp. DCM]|uniref:zinc ribbon domain-containing protein n=1 Tax=Dehalobacter sp. DCM TaxID=2907827 RepID=UPI003081FF06|nr:zinc ribbon domain-containing protein [Dehalobacter sp. DCM]